MNRDKGMSDFAKRASVSGYMQLNELFTKLKGKKVRFSLKNNNYERIVFFEAILAGFQPCKHLRETSCPELTDGTYRIENDKGIEIRVPMQKLIRIDESDSENTKHYFLIFERHFWSLEEVTG